MQKTASQKSIKQRCKKAECLSLDGSEIHMPSRKHKAFLSQNLTWLEVCGFLLGGISWKLLKWSPVEKTLPACMSWIPQSLLTCTDSHCQGFFKVALHWHPWIDMSTVISSLFTWWLLGISYPWSSCHKQIESCSPAERGYESDILKCDDTRKTYTTTGSKMRHIFLAGKQKKYHIILMKSPPCIWRTIAGRISPFRAIYFNCATVSIACTIK